MKTIQDVVRSMPWVTWKKGRSVCYNDTSYTKTVKKRRLKFTRIGIDITGHKRSTSGYTYPSLEAELKTALDKHGFKYIDISVWDDEIYVYTSEPITIIPA